MSPYRDEIPIDLVVKLQGLIEKTLNDCISKPNFLVFADFSREKYLSE